MKIDKQKIVVVVLIVWSILWVNFIRRDLFKGGTLKDYGTLVKRGQDSRRSYVYGDNFYSLLTFASRNLPPSATYSIEGVEDLSLKYRRAVYYLYPLLESRNADYVLVYNKPNYKRAGYGVFKRVSSFAFILKKK